MNLEANCSYEKLREHKASGCEQSSSLEDATAILKGSAPAIPIGFAACAGHSSRNTSVAKSYIYFTAISVSQWIQIWSQ